MHIEQSAGETHEDDRSLEFKFAFGVARERFRQAVDKTRAVPIGQARQSYFTAGISKLTMRPVGTCLLAYDYDEVTAGHGEALLVSVPIREVDLENPQVLTPDNPEYQEFFEIARPGEETGLVVNASSYADIFIEGQYHPVSDLLPKLSGYRVITLVQNV